MTAVPPTDWRSRVSDLDARDDAGNVLLWPWLFGSDDQVALDVGDQLDAGETLSVVSRSLLKLRAYGETDDADASASLSGAAQISGSVVIQRLVNLERGRYYRLEVLHGIAPNKRGASLLIHCPE